MSCEHSRRPNQEFWDWVRATCAERYPEWSEQAELAAEVIVWLKENE